MNRRKSRLYRQVEREGKKNIVLSIFGIIITLFVLFKFGIPALVNFSLFLSGSKQTPESNQNSTEVIVPPQLNPLPSATNSASFALSGKSQSEAGIDLYLNDSLLDKTQADRDGNFSFKSSYSKGDNKIYAKARLNNKVSDPSDTLDVLFKDTPPNLTISSPSDGQQFSKDQNTVSVTGSTDAGVRVTVNGFWAIVNQNNNFSYQLKLQNGSNNIKVEAVDGAGNKTDKELKVNLGS